MSDGTIGRILKSGASHTMLAAGLPTPNAITLSGAYVFWLSDGTPSASGSLPSTGTLMRVAN